MIFRDLAKHSYTHIVVYIYRGFLEGNSMQY